MGLAVYYQQDILNALMAAEQASGAAAAATGGQDGFAQGYMAGYRAALATLALAFGLRQLQGRENVETRSNLLSIGSRQDYEAVV
ncbi:MAG: hypothetical protein AMJ81_06095 [Phycisphaerae bacterium SM23_33]|nr:MAG: hypothetical protein AMJ81_06095 [Phycisphaerae bacterium SM23_33]